MPGRRCLYSGRSAGIVVLAPRDTLLDKLIVAQRPPLWYSGQSFWLQIQRSGFNSLRYQILWEVVGLKRSPLSLVRTTEELLGRKSSSSGLESQRYGRRDPSRWPSGTLYPLKLALTSETSGGRSVGVVRSRTHATELIFFRYSLSWPKNCPSFMVHCRINKSAPLDGTKG
jgi:hypothetical protein